MAQENGPRRAHDVKRPGYEDQLFGPGLAQRQFQGLDDRTTGDGTAPEGTGGVGYDLG
jgi:hypothetical protein